MLIIVVFMMSRPSITAPRLPPPPPPTQASSNPDIIQWLQPHVVIFLTGGTLASSTSEARLPATPSQTPAPVAHVYTNAFGGKKPTVQIAVKESVVAAVTAPVPVPDAEGARDSTSVTPASPPSPQAPITTQATAAAAIATAAAVGGTNQHNADSDSVRAPFACDPADEPKCTSGEVLVTTISCDEAMISCDALFDHVSVSIVIVILPPPPSPLFITIIVGYS